MNKKYFLYLPILLSIVLVVGIYLGKLYFTDNFSLNIDEQWFNKNFYEKSSSNKLLMLLNYIESEYVDSIDKDSLTEKAILALLENLDPHSVYIPASEFNEMNDPLEGEFEGIGIEFSIQSDTIVVMQTILGGPSEKVGLLAGDRIIKVNDSIVAGVGITNNKVFRLLKGPKGTKVKLHIKRAKHNKLLEFTIVRNKIPMHSVDISMKIAENIGYIKISRFAKTTPEEVREAIQKLHKQNIHNLIIDVRGNGGGYMDAAIEVADEFLDKGNLIVYTEGKSQPRKEYWATEKGIAHNDKIVILQDQWSASASEILAGAIQDNDRGYIVGQRSFGKGLVQEPIFFNDNSSIRLTVARYYTPSGRCIQRNYKTSISEYYTNLILRTDSIDSLDIKNAPTFKTKKGRIVYGNGGIFPDIKITHTDKQSDLFYKAASLSLIYQFAFKYTDQQREFLKTFKKWQDLDTYLQKSTIYNEFIQYINKQGIHASQQEIEQSKNIIMNHLRSYIVRNMFNDEGFYAISLENDKEIKEAIKLLSKNVHATNQ